MTRSIDLDDASARQATALLDEQRTAYGALLETLRANDAGFPNDPERSRATVLTAGRILRSLQTSSPALTALASRLRRSDCQGPNADAVRAGWTDVSAKAGEAGASYDRLIESLRADQGRTLVELRELGHGSAPGYGESAEFCAILVDRSG